MEQPWDRGPLARIPERRPLFLSVTGPAAAGFPTRMGHAPTRFTDVGGLASAAKRLANSASGPSPHRPRTPSDSAGFAAGATNPTAS